MTDRCRPTRRRVSSHATCQRIPGNSADRSRFLSGILLSKLSNSSSLTASALQLTGPGRGSKCSSSPALGSRRAGSHQPVAEPSWLMVTDHDFRQLLDNRVEDSISGCFRGREEPRGSNQAVGHSLSAVSSSAGEPSTTHRPGSSRRPHRRAGGQGGVAGRGIGWGARRRQSG